MSNYKIEHVIGRDGLHRLRLTSTVNGQIVDNSHEGFSTKDEAWDNLIRKLRAYLSLGFLEAVVYDAKEARLGVETLDERDPAPSNPIPCSIPGLAIDLIARDPLEPQQ